MKVMVVFGTRPEIIKLSVVLSRLPDHFETVTVFTTQNYDKNLSTIFFDDLDIPLPDHVLEYERGSSMSELGAILEQIDTLIKDERPDCFLILGDTNSCLSAIVAKKLKIPVFHLEAGNRCFDDRVPEEVNRRLIDTISDINMVYSMNAKQNLINEGFSLDRIFLIGSPMKEIISKYSKQINSSSILDELSLTSKNYMVLSTHRSEAVDNKQSLERIIEAVNSLALEHDCEIIFPCHPRTKNKINAFDLKNMGNIKIIQPLKFTDYMSLQVNSLLVISDSGTITEEASIMQFDALNLRTTHERQEGTDVGVVPLTESSSTSIVRNAKLSMDKRAYSTPENYTKISFSDSVLHIISGYTQYVKRTVYFE